MIRPVSSEDFYELMEIEARAAPKSEYDLWELRLLHARYPDTFLVEVSDKIDGYIVFSPGGHIISMAVRPERRRCGIGTCLVQKAIAHCAGKSLRLEVRLSNLGAQKFYEKLGFEKRALLRSYYHDHEDGLLMERPIKSKRENQVDGKPDENEDSN